MNKTQQILKSLKPGVDYSATDIRRLSGLDEKQSINVEVSQLVHSGILDKEGYGTGNVIYRMVDCRTRQALMLPMCKIGSLWGAA